MEELIKRILILLVILFLMAVLFTCKDNKQNELSMDKLNEIIDKEIQEINGKR